MASLVTHPHVCAVHDSGDEAGQAFLVCELLEGRALDELMDGAPLPAERVLDIAVQLTDALVASHRRGVVHGGVKPSNVFVTTDGHVKLLELGAVAAARPSAGPADSPSADTSASWPAPADATEHFHPYLSPEQVEGRPPDERSDIFATGALIYEMAAGAAPFAGATVPDVMAAIARAAPTPLRVANPTLPDVIDPIVARAMAREPEQRYASAAELYDDLRRIRRRLETPSGITRAGAPRVRPAAAGAIAAAVIVLAAVAAVAFWWTRDAASAAPRSTVLVGHLANGTADPDFDGTLREALAVYLGQSPYLDVVPDERLDATLRRMGREPGTRMTHDVAVDACQRLNLQAMIEGSVSAVGRATVIALVATDCSTGDTIAREQVEVQRKEDVLGALGEITASVRAALGESTGSLASHNVPIEDATTPSLDALKAYTEAAAQRAAGAELEAIPLLERAIAIDPGFALAYATLSTLYGGLGETGRAEELARLAYEHRERVSERERLFIVYQYHDRVTGDQLAAREALEVWKRTYPRDYRPANALALLLNRTGQYEAAAAEAEEARRRNPEHAFPYSNLAHAHRGAGRYADARRVAEEALARNLETLPMRRLLYQVAEIEGDAALAAQQLAWARSRRREFDFTGARAQVAAFRGRIQDARALYAEAIAGAREDGFAQIADGYAAQAALMEALYGFRAEAIALGRPVVRESTAPEAQLRAAAALALAGAGRDVEALLGRLRAERPEDTLL
ncbi:MAG TPA: protein kinase, partial [Myxococcota bacterium]|nr:protein kinase [Myxococcota bacterium]